MATTLLDFNIVGHTNSQFNTRARESRIDKAGDWKNTRGEDPEAYDVGRRLLPPRRGIGRG